MRRSPRLPAAGPSLLQALQGTAEPLGAKGTEMSAGAGQEGLQAQRFPCRLSRPMGEQRKEQPGGAGTAPCPALLGQGR